MSKTTPYKHYSPFLTSSQYQIQIFGFKGVVGVDERLARVVMRLRPSMKKFERKVLPLIWAIDYSHDQFQNVLESHGLGRLHTF